MTESTPFATLLEMCDQLRTERDAAVAERDHYIALAVDADADGVAILLHALRSIGATEQTLALWQQEAAAWQGECGKLTTHQIILIDALSFCLVQCRASGHLSNEPHIVRALAAIATARGETV